MLITIFDVGGALEYNDYYYMESVFITKILKIGTSHGVVIPAEVLRGYHWQRGDFLIFGFAGNEQLYLKRLSDVDLQKLKPNIIIN